MNPFKEAGFLSRFIDLYQENKKLWEVKHPLYSNRDVRKATLGTLFEFVKTRVPQAVIKFMDKKIGILRNMYKREHNKIQESLRSEAAADQVYAPRLWYYQKMRFLDDQTEARQSLSTLPPTLPSTLPSSLPSTSTIAEESQEELGPFILDEVDASSFSQDELSQEEALPSGREEEALPSGRKEEAVAGPSRSRTECQVPPLHITTKRPRKMTQTEGKSLALIREASQIPSTSPNAEEAYGTYMATRLLELEKGQRLFCEGLIFQAYQKGLRGELTAKTYLADEATPPPPAPSTPPEAQPPRKAAERRGGKAAGQRAGKNPRKSRNDCLASVWSDCAPCAP
ncbi:hypothetical protein AB205_0116460 [Aquarana catesbeiana]|uniref:MADF domain-containing protein n=1 Tax=Aquarana catesbeiana TaxID=8400 RepID=A0A2G9RMI1_AQUCT|nr:hypothetical protein AB205_0116460 [Aquarana catesbeiana]